MNNPIKTVEAFYAHALTLEREAAERYSELEAWFAGRGNDVVAGLCRNLAMLERAHLHEVLQASEGLSLPVIPSGQYRWIGAGSPEAVRPELCDPATSERDVLEAALHGEEDACYFFEWVARETPDARVRELAAEMAREEAQHASWLRAALEYLPARAIDWRSILERFAARRPGGRKRRTG